MSSAFDTLDHNDLIHRLSAIGIALNWFTSYITNRSSSVRINTHSSPSRSITYGVTQGSVLGPLLFYNYLLPMFDIFTDYPNIFFHTYADDLQLYLNCTDSPTYGPDRLSSCIKSIHHWLTSNSLKLNPTKTEAIFLYLPLRISTLPELPPISLDNTTLPYFQHVRNLGFHLDTTLSLDSHLIHMHKSIHYHLHCLRLIRRSIPLPIVITIASSYINPIFDYCNSLLFNIPEYKLIKLQRLKNAVVHCVHLLPRHSSDSISPLLKQLHWLPVPYRIKYKLSLTIHKAIYHNSPDYFASLLHLHTPITPLQTRSSNTPLPLPIYTNSILPIYDPLPSLPLTTGTHCPITYEQTHQLPPLNVTLRLIISPLPSLPLNNSLQRTADCLRTDAVHKPTKVFKVSNYQYIYMYK